MEEVDVYPDGTLTQEYVLPPTAVAPMDKDAPIQIAVLEITDAAGKALTVNVTELDFTHPFELVSVRVYVVETTGDAVGLETVDVKPDGTLTHE